MSGELSIQNTTTTTTSTTTTSLSPPSLSLSLSLTTQRKNTFYGPIENTTAE